MVKKRLILASSSPFRRELLNKLGLPFESLSPNIDESRLDSETPSDLVGRLSLEKAQAIGANHPHSLVIGSDQIAVLGNDIMTKPHEHEKAVYQLRKCSGKEVQFLTGLCLYNTETHAHQLAVIPFSVHFLPLTDSQIEHYLLKEKPYNCAGSFKAEGLGITLFSRLNGEDPNSLIGLPLIALTAMLRNEGVEPLE